MSKVHDKISKLLRMAEHGDGNEAEVAAKLAQKLMREHAITMASLTEEQLLREDPLQTKSIKVGRASWKAHLAWTVARHCQVSAVRSASGADTRMHGYGHRQDLEIWEYLYDVALRQIEKAAKQYGSRLEPDWCDEVYVDRQFMSKRKAMNRFRAGAVKGLDVKLRSLRREAADKVEQSTALVVQARADRARSYMERFNPRLRTYQGGVAGSGAGFKAGKEIAINKGLAAAAGRKQLGGK